MLELLSLAIQSRLTSSECLKWFQFEKIIKADNAKNLRIALIVLKF